MVRTKKTTTGLAKVKLGQTVVLPNGSAYAGVLGYCTGVVMSQPTGTLNSNTGVSIRFTSGSHNGSQYTVRLSEIKATGSTVEEIDAEISELNDQISILTSRKAFMKETKSDEFDEDVFKTYHVLQALEEKSMSNIDRAQVIAKLINS